MNLKRNGILQSVGVRGLLSAVLWLGFWCQEAVSSTRPAGSREELGCFILESASGLASFEEREGGLVVELTFATMNLDSADFPVSRTSVWVLLEQGGSAVFRGKRPGVGAGGANHMQMRVDFIFEKGQRPVAVVVGIGNEFRTFVLGKRSSSCAK
jgi:hypothetical protein